MERIKLLESYLSESPQDPFLHFALAKEWEGIGELKKALEKYEYLQKTYPEYVGTYYHLGKLYEQFDRNPDAIKCYEVGIKVAREAQDSHSAGELRGALDELIY